MSTNQAENTTRTPTSNRTADRTGNGGSTCTKPAAPLPISDDGFPPSRPRRGCPDC